MILTQNVISPSFKVILFHFRPFLCPYIALRQTYRTPSYIVQRVCLVGQEHMLFLSSIHSHCSPFLLSPSFLSPTFPLSLPSSPSPSSFSHSLTPSLPAYPHRTAVQPATDLDTVETASQTSQSSAYFSLSPTAGSITELSDTASIESYNEYDLKKKNGVSNIPSLYSHTLH